jgi:hypothetical protein
MAGAKQPASYYDYHGSFPYRRRKRFTLRQKAAYWKKKYFALLKRRSK